MRWIFRYNEQAAKYIGKILKKKMPEPQPWLHIAVKTMSARNPFSGAVIYVWDTRQIIWEYRSSANLFTTDMFKIDTCHMQRANDNRQPLVGGRKDVNEYFEFGQEFDASKGTAFDGKDRVKFTKLYARKAAKLEPKPGNEAFVPYDKVRPGMFAETPDGAMVKIIGKAKAKDFARISKYDDSGAMQDEIDDIVKDNPNAGLVAVLYHDKYPAVYLYDETAGATVDTDKQAKFNKRKSAKK